MNESNSLDPALAELVEELSNKLLAREGADLSAYLRAHPEHAEELRRLLPSLRALADVGRSAAQDEAVLGPAPPQVGRVLGDFRILREVGRGGMGVVYEAVQESLGRHVALKVLPADARLGPHQRERFQREARAAARLHHTNIVPIYGVGEDQGTHYFAMQFIDGQGLDAVLRGLRSAQPGAVSAETSRSIHGLRSGRFDEAQPEATAADPLEATTASGKQTGPGSDTEVEYFRSVARIGVQVASALDHAHRQGVLHRDIKPSNLLLTPDGTVWVADFGLAKVEGAEELTGTGDVVGTLRYLAPERFRGVSDPLGDVYSLGLTLYELATLRPAFAENDRLRLLDQIHKETPPRPRQLAPSVPLDLETIILKAGDKEPAQRYQTAEELAEDLRCFLAGEPIRARRLGLLERLGKFVRQNRGPVLAASLIILALAGGVVGTTIGFFRAEFARQLAQTNEQKALDAAEDEKKANDQAQKRLRQIEKGNEILAAVFTDLDPRTVEKAGKQLQAILGERLVKAGEQLEGEAVGDPLVVATMQDHLGRSLVNLGMADRAIPLFVKARATRTALLGPDAPETLSSVNNLAESYRVLGKLELALPLFEETLRRRKATLGDDDVNTLFSLSNLASAYRADHKLEQALPLYEEALRLRKATLGGDHPDTLTSMNNLANAYQEAHRTEEALPLLKETLRLRKAVLGDTHPDTFMSMNNLGSGYWAAGQRDQAVAVFEETLQLRRTHQGDNHPETLAGMNNLATVYGLTGKLDQALPLLREAAVGFEKRRFQHEYAASVINNLIDGLERRKQLEEAEEWRRKWLAVVKERAGADSLLYADKLVALSSNLLHQKKLSEAEAALRESLAICEKKEPQTWRTFDTRSRIGEALLGQKKYADAEPLLLSGYEGLRQRASTIPPAEASALTGALERIVLLYEAWGKPDMANEWRAKPPPKATKEAGGEKVKPESK
jgi:serine/threonine protein kinase